MRLFFEAFWMSKKSQRVPPFTIFGTVTLFKNLNFKIFSNFFLMFPKGPPFNFLKFCNQLEFHTAQRPPPFTILSLRYSADFGRSRLVLTWRKYNLLMINFFLDRATKFTDIKISYDSKVSTACYRSSGSSSVLTRDWLRCTIGWAVTWTKFCCNNMYPWPWQHTS